MPMQIGARPVITEAEQTRILAGKPPAAEAPKPTVGQRVTDEFSAPSATKPSELAQARYRAQGVLSDPVKKKLESFVVPDGQALREMPHGEHYLFLDHFRKSPPADREAMIKRLESPPTDADKGAYRGYVRTLKDLDQYLGDASGTDPKKKFSDEVLLLHMGRPTIQKRIQNFTSQFDSKGKFADAVGIRLRLLSLDGKTETIVGNANNPLASKTLMAVETGEGEQLHTVVLEAKNADQAESTNIQKLISEQRSLQMKTAAPLLIRVQGAESYEDVQNLHVELTKARRTAYSGVLKKQIDLALDKLRAKQVAPEAIVHRDQLLEGIRAYYQHLDQNVVTRDELLQKKKLMEFNIEQLKTDRNAPAGTREEFIALYDKIVRRLLPQDSKTQAKWHSAISGVQRNIKAEKSPAAVAEPVIQGTVVPRRPAPDDILDDLFRAPLQQRETRQPVASAAEELRPLDVAEARVPRDIPSSSNVDNFFASFRHTGTTYDIGGLPIWKSMQPQDIAIALASLPGEFKEQAPARAQQILRAMSVEQLRNQAEKNPLFLDELRRRGEAGPMAMLGLQDNEYEGALGGKIHEKPVIETAPSNSAFEARRQPEVQVQSAVVPKLDSKPIQPPLTKAERRAAAELLRDQKGISPKTIQGQQAARSPARTIRPMTSPIELRPEDRGSRFRRLGSSAETQSAAPSKKITTPSTPTGPSKGQRDALKSLGSQLSELKRLNPTGDFSQFAPANLRNKQTGELKALSAQASEILRQLNAERQAPPPETVVASTHNRGGMSAVQQRLWNSIASRAKAEAEAASSSAPETAAASRPSTPGTEAVPRVRGRTNDPYAWRRQQIAEEKKQQPPASTLRAGAAPFVPQGVGESVTRAKTAAQEARWAETADAPKPSFFRGASQQQKAENMPVGRSEIPAPTEVVGRPVRTLGAMSEELVEPVPSDEASRGHSETAFQFAKPIVQKSDEGVVPQQRMSSEARDVLADADKPLPSKASTYKKPSEPGEELKPRASFAFDPDTAWKAPAQTRVRSPEAVPADIANSIAASTRRSNAVEEVVTSGTGPATLLGLPEEGIDQAANALGGKVYSKTSAAPRNVASASTIDDDTATNASTTTPKTVATPTATAVKNHFAEAFEKYINDVPEDANFLRRGLAVAERLVGRNTFNQEGKNKYGLSSEENQRWDTTLAAMKKTWEQNGKQGPEPTHRHALDALANPPSTGRL